MNREAVKVSGTQVKDLLVKASGGIYLSKQCWHNVMTDFLKQETYEITEAGLKIEADAVTTVNLPIQEDKQYINYAIGGTGSETDDPDLEEEWEDSTYYDYIFNICGYTICFNVSDKGVKLTWEQFKELTDSGNYGIFEVKNVDAGSLYIAMNHCTIEVNDHEIEINNDTNMIIDKRIIDEIYNDSAEYEDICYRLEFNNGMSDMTIEMECKNKIL